MRKLSLILALATPLAALAAPAANADAYWGAPPASWSHPAAPAWNHAAPPYWGHAVPARPAWEGRHAAPPSRARFVPGHWAYDHRGRVWVPPRRW